MKMDVWGGEDCELLLREDELARWHPPPQKKMMKLDVGGGGGDFTYFMTLQFFLRGDELARL